MKIRNTNRSLMKWKVMDALDMDYKDETFDVVIDKSEFHIPNPLPKAPLMPFSAGMIASLTPLRWSKRSRGC